MGDIENFAYDYCEGKISRLSRLLLLLKHDCKHIKLFLNEHKIGKICHIKWHISQYWTIIASYDYFWQKKLDDIDYCQGKYHG